MENMEKLKWREIRTEFKKINPQLAQIIDEIDPNDEFALYKVRYHWGDYILKNGILKIPNSTNELVSIDDFSIEKKITEDLAYNAGMPIGIVLKKSIELYIFALQRIIPFKLMHEGTIFGLWIGLHEDKMLSSHSSEIWNVVAGARSTILLPKISNVKSYKRIKKICNYSAR